MVALLALVQLSAFMDRALPSVLAPQLKTAFGLSDAAFGALQGPAFVSVYVVGLLVAGHWMSRFDPWRLIAACVAVWTAGMALFAFATSFEGLAAGRVLLGLGQAALAPTALALVGGQADPSVRARSLSLMTAGSASGRSAALLLGGAVLALLGGGLVFGLDSWRAASLVMAAPNLLLIAFLLTRRASAAATAPGVRGLGPALAVVRNRPADFLSLAAVGGGCIFLVQAAGAWAPSILNRDAGLSPADSALVFGLVMLVFAPLGHISAGRILGRAGEGGRVAPLLLVGLAIAAASAALLPWSGFPASVALLAGLTFGGGMTASAVMIRLQIMTPDAVRAPMSAFFLVVTSLAGVAGGPWVTGLLSDVLAPGGQGLSRALAITVCGVAAVVAAIVATRARGWIRAEAAS